MARKQVLVQLSDDLVLVLDRIARQRHLSRSHLIREAVEQYTAAERHDEISRQIVEGYTRTPQEPDPAALASAVAGGRALDEDERQAGHEPW